MKGNSNRLPGLLLPIAVAVFSLLLLHNVAESKLIKAVYQLPEDQITVETKMAPIAAYSDSVFCGDRLLDRKSDYRINYRTGRITFDVPPLCDSITVVLFLLPEWMMESSGNKVPAGKKFLVLPADLSHDLSQTTGGVDKVNLSGNKSFSFTVGRSGQAGFSQGLNVDFEAVLASGVKVRGSVSDRIGSSGQILSNGGVTTIISELDKYFFEIEGTKFSIQGGDIITINNQYLPLKRIKGMRASYQTKNSETQFNIGRPAGRYESIRLTGQDGRQGPYQMATKAGLPTAVVPGSEKVYLDGQVVSGGDGRDYLIDYPAGRITFSPRQLITLRSRIEIDFEASSNNYEQTEMSGWSQFSFLDDAVSIGIGGRRESDDEDRFRFGSFSAVDILKLEQAGDSSDRAFNSGVVSDSSGAYIVLSDSIGNTYYKHVGEGQGDYSIGFSFTGEGRGDYFYLGDGVYLYAGTGLGSYLPIRFLPLPRKNDYWVATARFPLFSGTGFKIDYQLTDRDDNLFSTRDDGDNRQGRLSAVLNYNKEKTSAQFEYLNQQNKFEAAHRLDEPDFKRVWALPDLKPFGDETRWLGSFQTEKRYARIDGSGGYLSYKDSLDARKVVIGLELFQRSRLSPRFRYQSGQSERKSNRSLSLLYERYQTGLRLGRKSPISIDLDYDRELEKDMSQVGGELIKYSKYRGNLFFRNTVVSLSRRIDFRSGLPQGARNGPQLDKISIISEERLGRLSLSGSGLISRQKRLESNQGDLESRLFVTALGYSSRSGWLNFRMEYRQNRQQRHMIGYRFIPALDGQGNYRFEEGEYLFDPDGEFIRLEEERGEAQGVTVGEKNHTITIYPGRLKTGRSLNALLSQFSFRIRTEVIEEQIGSDKLQMVWLLPWSSQSGRSYLNRLIRERYSALMLPRSNYYVLNFLFTNSFEERDRGLQLNRTRKEYALELKSALSSVMRVTITGKHIRNGQSGLILVGLAMRENRVGLQFSYEDRIVRIKPKLEYLFFSDHRSELGGGGGGGGEGNGWSVENSFVVRQPGRGEIRFDLQFRSLKEAVPFSQPEYLVTGGSRFGNSGIIGLVVNYDIARAMRLTLNIKNRLFQDRTPEIVARGELVASF